MPEQTLLDHFGESGRYFWQLAHGRDGRTVIPDREAKALSPEVTFAEDIGDRHVLRTRLLELVDDLAGQLRQSERFARTIEIKRRSSSFQRGRTPKPWLSPPTAPTVVRAERASGLRHREMAVTSPGDCGLR